MRDILIESAIRALWHAACAGAHDVSGRNAIGHGERRDDGELAARTLGCSRAGGIDGSASNRPRPNRVDVFLLGAPAIAPIIAGKPIRV